MIRKNQASALPTTPNLQPKRLHPKKGVARRPIHRSHFLLGLLLAFQTGFTFQALAGLPDDVLPSLNSSPSRTPLRNENRDRMGCPDLGTPVQGFFESTSQTYYLKVIEPKFLHNRNQAVNTYFAYDGVHYEASAENSVLYGSFASSRTSGLTTLPIGFVEENLDTATGVCLALRPATGISFVETVKKIKNNCGPLGSFGCGSTRWHSVQIEKKDSNETYTLKSDTSVSAR